MRRLVLLSVLVAAACASPQGPTLDPLRAASDRAAAGRQDAHALALAGWYALFDGGDAARAESLAARAVSTDPTEPWARLLRGSLAMRRLDPVGEAEEMIALLQGAPSHPLAVVAAGRLERSVGHSPALDQTIEAAVRPLLDGPTQPEARDRLRSVLQHLASGASLDELAPVVQARGLLTAGSVVGPFSDFHALEQGRVFPPETRAPIEAAYGDRQLRPFSFPTGRISLRSEEARGDVYYVLAVAEVPSGGAYALRLDTAGSTGAIVSIDGERVLEREAFPGPAPTRLARAVDLRAGSHLVALRIVRGRGGGDARLSLAPLDGSASQIRFRAAAPGDRPGDVPSLLDAPALQLGFEPRTLARALAGEGGVVAWWAAALDAASGLPDEARALVDVALSQAPRSTPLLWLRSELVAANRSLPDRIAAARAAQDREAILSLDEGHAAAILEGAQMLARANRTDEALAAIDRAAEAAPKSDLPTLERARIAWERGLEGDALVAARRLATSPSVGCAALRLQHELARRIDAADEVESTARALLACGDGRPQLAALLAAQGDARAALDLARQLAEEAPQDLGAAHRLVDALVAVGQVDEAVEVLAAQEAHWPRNAWLLRRRAELLERIGDRRGAKAAREQALQLHGSDLTLRRMLALEAGGDVLDWSRRDGIEIARTTPTDPRWDTPAVMLLDQAAVEVQGDGSRIERTHTVTRLLDRRGIEQFGEVHLPAGAEVIHLRTIKPDGTFLVPETIHGKESISMPGLNVGDSVEIEFLQAYGPPPPALPGWSASPFYFRAAGLPFVESTYRVRAHQDAGLQLDVHNGMQGAPIERSGEWMEVSLRRTDVPALVPEPDAPSLQEYLPWAQVGAGTDPSRVFALFADNLAGAAAPTLEVRQWAASVAEGLDREATIRALYDASMDVVEGSDRGFRTTAARVLASGRGNRMLLLKAALDARGIDARYAAVRPYDRPQGPRLFADASDWGHLVLVVRPTANAPWIWLDPGTRYTPFGTLAPRAQEVEAWILPRLGETAPQRTTTPAAPGESGRQIEMDLTLLEDGSLQGRGVERYLGYEAASARNTLERLDETRLRQVVEGGLARQFPGLALDSVEQRVEGGATELHYAFTQAGAARELDADRRLLRLDPIDARLGARFLSRATRETPLLIASPEQVTAEVRLHLPEGMTVERGAEAARAHARFGDFRRDVGLDGGTLAIREELRLERGRIEPVQYADFADWVREVDAAQQLELVVR